MSVNHEMNAGPLLVGWQPSAGRWPAALLCPLVILSSTSGCKTANYQADNLPAFLRVAAATPANGLNLARMAGPGSGTSRIGPGDLLELTIVSGYVGEEITPVNARVSADGQIAVPLIGLVPVAGLEPFEAEQQIVGAAVERQVYRQPNVTLRVIEPAVNRVTVLGAVANPGVHELRRGSSDLANALAAAGGLTEEAGTMVDVFRQGTATSLAADPGESFPRGESGVNLASYESVPWSPPSANRFAPPPLTAMPTAPRTVRLDLEQMEPAAGPNFSLSDRDVVMVLPDEKRFIHVTGLVLKADRFEIPKHQDIRVLDAIAMAGGVTSPVADKAFVIRQLPNMPEPVVIQVSIRQAKRDGNENLRLAPGDLVSVESTAATAFVDTVNNLFRLSLGLGGNLVTF
jgi:polysaccharide export outer membrane protein